MKSFLFIFFLCASAVAGIIPDSRTNDWSLTGAGAGAGLTIFTPIGVNVLTTTNPRYKCAGDGVTDDTVPIQNALIDFATGKRIYLPTGKYRITERIFLQPWQGFWTLHGDGPGNTIIIGDFASATDMFYCGNGDPFYTTNEWPILSGYTKGSTNLVLCSTNTAGNPGPAWLAVGNMVLIDQLNDGVSVTNTGCGGIDGGGVVTTNHSTTFDIHADGTRNQKQYVEIEAISNGTNLTIWPPLAVSFNASQRPWLNIPNVDTTAANQQHELNKVVFDGLTFTNKANTHTFISFLTSKSCGATNCEFQNAGHGSAPVLTQDGLWFQMSRNYFGTSSTNSDCVLYMKRTDSGRIEDNIFNTGGWIFESSCGDLVDYNFATNEPDASANHMQGGASVHHGPHDYMILCEGNVVGGYLQADYFWGSSGQLVFFRNHILGTDNGTTENLKCISLDRFSLSNSIVGNVLGASSVTWTGMDANPSVGYPYTDSYIYRFGYPLIGANGFTGTPGVDTTSPGNWDGQVTNTLFRTGNYDYFHNAIQWDGSGVQTIPNSLVYASTPSWWDNSAWPGVDPANPSLARNPAMMRFIGGNQGNGQPSPSGSITINFLNVNRLILQ